MMFDFILAIEFDGQVEAQAFKLSARTFAMAVSKALLTMTANKPNAVLTRLTYFHPPID